MGRVGLEGSDATTGGASLTVGSVMEITIVDRGKMRETAATQRVAPHGSQPEIGGRQDDQIMGRVRLEGSDATTGGASLTGGSVMEIMIVDRGKMRETAATQRLAPHGSQPEIGGRQDDQIMVHAQLEGSDVTMGDASLTDGSVMEIMIVDAGKMRGTAATQLAVLTPTSQHGGQLRDHGGRQDVQIMAHAQLASSDVTTGDASLTDGSVMEITIVDAGKMRGTAATLLYIPSDQHGAQPGQIGGQQDVPIMAHAQLASSDVTTGDASLTDGSVMEIMIVDAGKMRGTAATQPAVLTPTSQHGGQLRGHGGPQDGQIMAHAQLASSDVTTGDASLTDGSVMEIMIVDAGKMRGTAATQLAVLTPTSHHGGQLRGHGGPQDVQIMAHAQLASSNVTTGDASLTDGSVMEIMIVDAGKMRGTAATQLAVLTPTDRPGIGGQLDGQGTSCILKRLGRAEVGAHLEAMPA